MSDSQPDSAAPSAADARGEVESPFLQRLDTRLKTLGVSSGAMLTAAAEALARELGLPRVAFATLDQDGVTVVSHFFNDSGRLPPIAGLSARLHDYGPALAQAVLAGHSLRVEDVTTDPRFDARAAAAHRALGARAALVVPLPREERTTGFLLAHDTHPHQWSDHEEGLLRRTAALVGRATDRAEAAGGVRALEGRYRSLFDCLEDGFCVVQMIFDDRGHPTDYRFVDANPAFAEHTGLVNALGHTALELVPNLDRWWIETYGRVALTGEPARFENHASAMHRWFDVYTFRLGSPEERLVAIFFNDTTSRKLAEAALRDSEERLRLILANVKDHAIFTLDLEGRITTWNPGAQRIFGWHDHEVLGRSAAMLFTPEDRAADRPRTELKQADEGAMADNTREHLRKDGSRFFSSGSLEGLRDASGQLLGFVKIIRDITALKQNEEKREQLLQAERTARAEAEHAGRMKDEFLATLSHELRTPLNAMLGWAQVLAGTDKTDAALIDQGLAVIERNATAQAQLIEDLLDMSRIISGKVRLDVRRVDLPALIETAIDAVRPAAAAKHIRVTHTLDTTGASTVGGDPDRLQQVLWNLLTNAVKFTAKGGRVHVVLEQVNSHLEINIADSGQGIAPEFLPHVFERFRQADASTTRTHAGLGLGLAIVKHLVELHGGEVRATSAGVGRGSTFTVLLPLGVVRRDADSGRPPRSSASAPVSPGPVPGTTSLTGVRVLYVDDEADARALIRRVLEDRGATVTTAESVDAAYTAFRAAPPQVLVSDIGMPHADGYEMIRRVRALPPAEGGAVPAIALTAFARSEDRQHALLAGYQMHLRKPVEPAELLAAIQSLVRLLDR